MSGRDVRPHPGAAPSAVAARSHGARRPCPREASSGRATVQGRLHTAEVRPAERNGVLACEITDSTGDLVALFYGRTRIAGIEPGCRIRLHGMVGIAADGRPAMINPGYELLR